jgi:D-glycero-D-manno-heptose 1,7-bisphosphate phosphatase
LLRILFSKPSATLTGPAIFIDRDGVINCRRPDDYVLNFSQFVFVPGIRAALKQLASLALPMIVISNQAAVGKGLLDTAGLEELTTRMQQALLEDGTAVAAAYFCTHRTDENCICRKPKPELLHRAADDFNIDLSRSIFIGDSQTDVEAARAAGCQPILLGSGLRNGSDSIDWMADLPIARQPGELLEVAIRSLHELEFRGPSEATEKRAFPKDNS